MAEGLFLWKLTNFGSTVYESLGVKITVYGLGFGAWGCMLLSPV